MLMTRAPVSYFITTITEGRFTTSLHHDIVYCIQRSVYILDDRYRVRVSVFCMSAYLMLIFFSCSRCQLGCSTNPLTLLYISDLPATTHQENGRRYHIYQLGWVLTVCQLHHCSPKQEEAMREEQN